MPTVVTNVGASNANSYASVAEADAYHAGMLSDVAAIWDDADLEDQQRALITATRLLDQHLDWIGVAMSPDQALSWPRALARTRNGFLFATDVIPSAVKDATAELARRLLESGLPSDQASGDDLKSLKAGPVSLEFRETTTDPLPDPVYQMVKFLAYDDTAGTGIRSVPVIRT